jgi:hypothetical protein
LWRVRSGSTWHLMGWSEMRETGCRQPRARARGPVSSRDARLPDRPIFQGRGRASATGRDSVHLVRQRDASGYDGK